VQQRHPELAVSNFGVGLYGTYQSYLAMQRSVHGPATVYYLLAGGVARALGIGARAAALMLAAGSDDTP